jgi:hypothetical protein
MKTMYRVGWYQSGTGYRLEAGPFETIEEAQREPYKRLYPPESLSIVVWKVQHVEVSQ